MDDDFADAVAGALSAQKFLLENLYAMLLNQQRDPLRDCKAMAKESLRQFEDIPPTNAQELSGDEAFRVTQHGIHHLERFWAGVQARLESVKI